MRTSILVICLAIIVSFSPARDCNATEPASEAAVEKFKQLQDEFKERREHYYKLFEAAAEDEQETLYEKKYPSETMVQEFLDLEQECRGTIVGLSCLNHLVTQGRGVGPTTRRSREGRIKAVKLLHDHYADEPELERVLVWLNSGNFYSEESLKLLERAAQSPNRHLRGAALLYLAENLKVRAVRPLAIRQRLELMTEEDSELSLYQDSRFFQSLYRGIDAEASRKRAMEVLDLVRSDYADIRLAALDGAFEPVLLKMERGLTEEGEYVVGHEAERLKFELTRLTIGQEIPDIERPDAFGKPLKLSDQRGKVAVLFFSSDWCGVCKAMYPSNRELIDEMKGRPFVFLGVLGDETVETVHEAVERGQITWPVWWTGPGPEKGIPGKWNVHSWPTCFVIDHKGIIRYRISSELLLRRAVLKLVEEAEAAK